MRVGTVYTGTTRSERLYSHAPMTPQGPTQVKSTRQTSRRRDDTHAIYAAGYLAVECELREKPS
jgi:hypothetical protein